MPSSDLSSYVDWDVTDWVKSQVAAGESTLTFRLSMGETDATGLLYLYSMESDDTRKPQLLVSSQASSGIETTESQLHIYTRPAEKSIVVKGLDGSCRITCYTLCGQPVFSRQIEGDGSLELPDMTSGVYLLNLHNETLHHTCKIIL